LASKKICVYPKKYSKTLVEEVIYAYEK